ncbi:MAG TPA: antibiotic biosynthesis monooxygenase family protein [Syntrophales bacterium]|nr:antibiotic biosynthesis monooxygenase family protein [Syntrophales bacterium]
MVRVIIERHCKPGKEAQLRDLLIELRTAAMRQHGYISGETLRDLDDPSLFIIISTWASLETWKMWEVSGRRLQIEQQLDNLITADARLRICALDYEI